MDLDVVKFYILKHIPEVLNISITQSHDKKYTVSAVLVNQTPSEIEILAIVTFIYSILILYSNNKDVRIVDWYYLTFNNKTLTKSYIMAFNGDDISDYAFNELTAAEIIPLIDVIKLY